MVGANCELLLEHTGDALSDGYVVQAWGSWDGYRGSGLLDLAHSLEVANVVVDGLVSMLRKGRRG
jgi:hypothetical protein